MRVLEVDFEAPITIFGGRCQSCGMGTDSPEWQDAAVWERSRVQWEIGGLGHLVQRTYPMVFPAWLVRQGFSCPLCDAPNVLLQMTPDEDVTG